MSRFNFLRRRPLEQGDDEQVRRVLAPLNIDGRFLIQRCIDPDGSPRLIRVIDVRDRYTADEGRHAEEIRRAAAMLWEAGFDVYELPTSRSDWGDLEIHERS